MDDAERLAYLERRVRELMDQVRELSLALCQAPRPGEYRSTVYREWFWKTRHKAIHGTENLRRLEPESYAARMLPRKHDWPEGRDR